MFVDVLTLLVFVLACGGIFLLLNPLFSGRDAEGAEAETLPLPGPLARFLSRTIPQPAKEIAGIEKELRQAGYYERHALTRYLGTRNGLLWMIVIFTVGAAMGVVANARATATTAVLGAIFFVAVYGLPRLYLQSRAQARVNRIMAGLPDALDMITMGLNLGLPLSEAVPHVATEIAPTHPDIARELKIIQKHADAGSMTQALEQFAERTDVPDVRTLAAIIGQTERLGTNAATAIRDYADAVRRTARQRIEERASKLGVKMLFPIVLCLTPPVFIVLCGPPLLSLKDFITRTDNRLDRSMIPGPARLPNAPAPSPPGIAP